MELSRMICRYNREGKGVFDQFYLDEDLNVPDAKEDVKQMIESSAEVKVEDLKQVENYVRASGKVYFRALYQTASVDSMPEILEGKIPFEEMIYIEPEEGEEYYIRNLRSELTVTVVNSRKLGLRAMVELELGREKTVEEEIPVDVESEIPVYKKCRKMNMLQLRTTKKDTYRIKEELTLPGTKESIGQLLMTDVTNRKLEIRPGQDELILRGELLVFCMYLSGEEKTDWVSQTLNYEGRILCDGVTEEMYYSVQHTLEDPLVDIRMDEDGEMRILGIEGTLSLRISIYEEEEPEILETGWKVAIDPGHQAKGNSEQEPVGPGASEMKAKVASGTSGRTTGVAEYELNLAVGLKLKEELLNRGYEVYMIRETHDVDISNAQRAQLAAESGADILVRIHANGSENSSVAGALTMAPSSVNPYMGGELVEQCQKLSEIIIESFCETTGAKNQGVYQTDTMSGLNWCTIPATIVEMGYMTNPEEDTKMQTEEYQSMMVQGIANGIDRYFHSS